MRLFSKYVKDKHSKKFLVYTVYEQGILLYIGNTKNPIERFKQHHRYKNNPIFVLECDSEISMRFMETILINKLNPKGNKQKPKFCRNGN